MAVFHTRDNRWIVTDPECPHEQGSIVDAIFGVGRLHCPIHNFSYDIATGKSNSEEVGELKIYRTLITDNKLFCKL